MLSPQQTIAIKPTLADKRQTRRPVTWNGFSDCAACPVRQSALFAHMSETDFDAIHYPIDQLKLQPGAVLSEAGERADYLFTVRTGALKVEQRGQSGRTRVTAMMVKGDLVGMPAFVLGRYDANVVALTDATVCRMPIVTLKELEQRSPRFMQGMHEKWHGALVATNSWLIDIGMGQVRERLARLLLRFPVDDYGVTQLCSRRELGVLLGDVALETISRQMSALRQAEVIEFSEPRGRQVRIDRAALTAIAGYDQGE